METAVSLEILGAEIKSRFPVGRIVDRVVTLIRLLRTEIGTRQGNIAMDGRSEVVA